MTNSETKAKNLFDHEPLCEVCRLKPAISFSMINDKWQFTCECTSNYERYWLYIDDFFRSPRETLDWLAHLHEKPWVDANDFFKTLHRFRKQAFGWEV